MDRYSSSQFSAQSVIALMNSQCRFYAQPQPTAPMRRREFMGEGRNHDTKSGAFAVRDLSVAKTLEFAP